MPGWPVVTRALTFAATTLVVGPVAAVPAAAAAAAGHADDGVPVTVSAVTRSDVPIYASGLGTVTALNSVLIRPRVDGPLETVTFTEGQEVKRGDLLATIDPRPYQAALDQAAAKRAQDAAGLTNAQRDLVRYSTLARAGYATRQSADTQSATVQANQSQLAADQAAIEAAALNLSFTHITSPIDGRVGLRQINPGNQVHAADSQGIVTVTQMQPIGVLFTLPQESVGAVAAAQNAGMPEVQAIDQNGTGVLASGSLLTADNTINPATGTIQLKAVFANADRRLWPGEFVQARVRLRTLKGVLTIPARAVQRGQDGLFVYVAAPDGKAQLRAIREYQEQDEVAAVASGLQEGERVIVDGQSRVSNGVGLSVRAGNG